MDNAGIGFKLLDVEQDVEAPKTVVISIYPYT
jgi:hypothetical protein